MPRLSDCIILSAEAGLRLQRSNGSMPAGWNGPWGHEDTSTRNTAHWTITFLKAWELTRNDTFRAAARSAAEYLTSASSRPMGAAFWCRNMPGKSSTNGLIGQAWTMEALATASAVLGDDRYVNVAKEVFLLHPFVTSAGLWRDLTVDGKALKINATFNQQIWFGTIGAILCSMGVGNKKIEDRVRVFFEGFVEHMSLYGDGLVCHSIRERSSGWNAATRARKTVGHLRRKYSTRCIYLSTGYHSFLLYALALLRWWLGDAFGGYLKNREIVRAIKHSMSKRYSARLTTNEFALSYNPTGFELALVLQMFGSLMSDVGDCSGTELAWTQRQIDEHFCRRRGLLVRNTSDPSTLAARIYEATRLADMEIQL